MNIKTVKLYKILDDEGMVFRIVKTKWERDNIINLYHGFRCDTILVPKTVVKFEDAPF